MKGSVVPIIHLHGCYLLFTSISVLRHLQSTSRIADCCLLLLAQLNGLVGYEVTLYVCNHCINTNTWQEVNIIISRSFLNPNLSLPHLRAVILGFACKR